MTRLVVSLRSLSLQIDLCTGEGVVAMFALSFPDERGRAACAGAVGFPAGFNDTAKAVAESLVLVSV